MHLSPELILCTQIPRVRVHFNGFSSVKSYVAVLSPLMYAGRYNL